MEISVLSSGSSGNCFYIENNHKGLLVDCGISCRQVFEKMFIIGKKPKNIRGVFITHEHSDHVKGTDVLARYFNIPIFANKETIKSCTLCSNEKLINEISKNETFNFNGLQIEVFSKSHKAINPVFFSIMNNKRLSIITDAGLFCKNIEQEVKDSDFLCLESNHDIKMLEDGPYPIFLKKWIKSDIGHLSNLQASLGILEHASPRLKGVILSHLSETNNTPKIALKTFSNLIKERQDLNPQVAISTRVNPTKIFRI